MSQGTEKYMGFSTVSNLSALTAHALILQARERARPEDVSKVQVLVSIEKINTIQMQRAILWSRIINN